MVFALDVAGSSGRGTTFELAVGDLRRNLRWAKAWRARHGLPVEYSLEAQPTAIQAVEATGKPLEGDTEAFFDWDAGAWPLEELASTARLLSLSRADLLQHLDAMPDALLDHRSLPAARTLREIADHIAIAEWWYTTRMLDDPSVATSWSEFGDNLRERLERIRTLVFEQYFSRLSSMTVSQRRRRFTHAGETWTARKTLRRMVWHELYHLKQIEARLVLLRPDDVP